MSYQLLDTINRLNAMGDVNYVEDATAMGIGQILQSIECSDAEQVVLTALADVCRQPTPLYSVALARAVAGRELAAEGVIRILRACADDVTVDDVVRALSYALARELSGVVRIVDALERDPMDPRRLCLDGPLQG